MGSLRRESRYNWKKKNCRKVAGTDLTHRRVVKFRRKIPTSDRCVRCYCPVGLIGVLSSESEGPSGGVGFPTTLAKRDDDKIQFRPSPEISVKVSHHCSDTINEIVNAAIKQRMEKDVDEVSKVARFIKLKIEELDKENLSNRSKPGCGKGSAVDRSRTATTVSLKKKFKDKMSEFQTLRENIHKEYREVVERRVYTVTGNRADEETIDRLIETGDSEQIFQKAIREQGRGQIMDTLAEIQERHDAVRELERKLLELQQIFLDMAVLVDAQGDMLDNIESQVISLSLCDPYADM
ncbi:hypothetical protein MTR67_002601, partial [Solanum verrucosum]